MIGKTGLSIPKHAVPWHMVRIKCTVCGGHHAPWWGTVAPPSCREGDPRTNDLVMFLETTKALGQ